MTTTVARLGGDEFVVLLTEVFRHGHGPDSMVERIHANLCARRFSSTIWRSKSRPAWGSPTSRATDRMPTRFSSARTSPCITQSAIHLSHAAYSAEHDHHSLARLALAGDLRRAVKGMN